MPLHIDYRPQELNEIFGNKTVVKAVKTILERKSDIPKAWMFHGSSGCGKTTIGRIIASKLGCPPEIGGQPNPDYAEVNAADDRGIDSARAIIRQAKYPPLHSKVRVWILDEIQALTQNFQQAILKILEDTPKDTYFILCTTDPSKLLPTLKNRCTQFEVKKLDDSEMLSLLNAIIDAEEAVVPEKTIKRIIQEANGCPRQALVYLDQVIDLSIEDAEKAIVGLETEESQAIDLCRILFSRSPSWHSIKDILNNMDKNNPEKIRQSVLNYAKAVALKQSDPSYAFKVMFCFKDPFFNNGFAGVVMACIEIVSN